MGQILTTLGRAVVLAWSGSARFGAASLLDAQRPTLVDFTLQTLFGRVSLFGSDHLDEAKAARLLSVRVAHDVTLLDVAVLLKETCDLLLGEGRVNARDEQVGALVAAALVFGLLASGRWTTTCPSADVQYERDSKRTGCRDYREHRVHWARRCGHARCRHHDAHHVGTGCGRVRSREARLRVRVSE